MTRPIASPNSIQIQPRAESALFVLRLRRAIGSVEFYPNVGFGSELERIDVERESRTAHLGRAAQIEKRAAQELVQRSALRAPEQELSAITSLLALHRLRRGSQDRDVFGREPLRDLAHLV